MADTARAVKIEGIVHVLGSGPVPVSQRGDVVVITAEQCEANCRRLETYVETKGPKKGLYQRKLKGFKKLLATAEGSD